MDSIPCGRVRFHEIMDDFLDALGGDEARTVVALIRQRGRCGFEELRGMVDIPLDELRSLLRRLQASGVLTRGVQDGFRLTWMAETFLKGLDEGLTAILERVEASFREPSPGGPPMVGATEPAVSDP